MQFVVLYRLWRKLFVSCSTGEIAAAFLSAALGGLYIIAQMLQTNFVTNHCKYVHKKYYRKVASSSCSCSRVNQFKCILVYVQLVKFLEQLKRNDSLCK